MREGWNQLVQYIGQAGDVFTLVDALKAIKDIQANTLQAQSFKTWVENNCGVKRTQAYEYIAVYKNWDSIVRLTGRTADIFTLVDA
jgi:hypothetical protein